MSDWLAHYGRKGMKWHKHVFGKEASDSEKRFGRMETKIDEYGTFQTLYVTPKGKADRGSERYSSGVSGSEITSNYVGPGNARYMSGRDVKSFIRDHRDVSVVQATGNVTKANVQSLKRARAEIMYELSKNKRPDIYEKAKPVGNSKERPESRTRKKVRYSVRKVFGQSNKIV